jgi:hypothetical protein
MATLLHLNTPDLDTLKLKINDIFFDIWTMNLYMEYYNLSHINMDILIRNILFSTLLNKESHNFINLHYKRLVFIEYLLTPFLRAISNASKSILNNQLPYRLNINSGEIIKHFFVKLDKFNFYNSVN